MLPFNKKSNEKRARSGAEGKSWWFWNITLVVGILGLIGWYYYTHPLPSTKSVENFFNWFSIGRIAGILAVAVVVLLLIKFVRRKKTTTRVVGIPSTVTHTQKSISKRKGIPWKLIGVLILIGGLIWTTNHFWPFGRNSKQSVAAVQQPKVEGLKKSEVEAIVNDAVKKAVDPFDEKLSKTEKSISEKIESGDRKNAEEVKKLNENKVIQASSGTSHSSKSWNNFRTLKPNAVGAWFWYLFFGVAFSLLIAGRYKRKVSLSQTHENKIRFWKKTLPTYLLIAAIPIGVFAYLGNSGVISGSANNADNEKILALEKKQKKIIENQEATDKIVAAHTGSLDGLTKKQGEDSTHFLAIGNEINAVKTEAKNGDEKLATKFKQEIEKTNVDVQTVKTSVVQLKGTADSLVLSNRGLGTKIDGLPQEIINLLKQQNESLVEAKNQEPVAQAKPPMEKKSAQRIKREEKREQIVFQSHNYGLGAKEAEKQSETIGRQRVPKIN